MALTAALITANPALAALTPEQITALETLSTNDENTVIGKKVGEIHGQYQRDAEEATGLKQPAGIKTYDWLKTDVFAKAKTATELETQITTLKTEKTDLEKKIKEGSGDEALKTKVTDLTTQITNLQTAITTKETEYKTALDAAESEKLGIYLDKEFDAGLIGIQFKDEKLMPKEVRDAYLATAKAEILKTHKPDLRDDGKGGKELIFRNDKGEIITNPQNLANPIRANELLIGKLTPIIEAGKQQAGGGGAPPAGGGGAGGGAVLDLTGITTQSKATDAISEHLMARGLSRGTQEFADEQMKMYNDNKLSELPVS